VFVNVHNSAVYGGLRLAWAIEHLDEHGINHEDVMPALRRVHMTLDS
jgi:hypothetical protein